MKNRLLGIAFIVFFCFTLFCNSSDLSADQFKFRSSVMKVEDVKPGMSGLAYTVVRGEEVITFPVTVISVIPQDGVPSKLIMIKAHGPLIDKTGGIAAGMSGSPVYIDGKLIGAIGYGWNFSDHTLGLVTPARDMAEVFNWPSKEYPFFSGAVPAFKSKAKSSSDDRSILAVSGLSDRSVSLLEKKTHEKMVMAGVYEKVINPVMIDPKLVPGDAVGAMLVWGDVSIGATGTLSALSRDGRFLAFAHPFINGGMVAIPLSKAYVHHIVPSIESPFKISSFGPIVGTITQDRPQAIGGKIGFFAPSVGLSLRFYDRDSKIRSIKRFHTIPDPHYVSKIVPTVVMGLVDNLWGRRGYGTARTSVSIEGGGLSKGWSYTDYYFSDMDISKKLSEEIESIMSALVLNPFYEISPLGIHFSVEVSEKPRILYIERLAIEGDSFSPGDDIEVKVTLRPYREKSIEKKFILKIPEEAYGLCQVVVRGGGLGELTNGSGDFDRSIETFPQLLKELDDRERYNEVIIELQYQDTPQAPDESPRSAPFPGELRRMKLHEKSMKVYRSDYYVEGSLQKSFLVSKEEKSKEVL